VSRATRDSAAARSLLARVESRSTGKLTVGAGAAEIAVFLLDGDVVAATAADDDRDVVRMLLALGEIDEATAARITVRLDEGGDAFQGLLGVGDILDHVLAERFRQNLADYLASPSAPRFLDQRALFVTNIQMGHDTRRLIDELCLQCDISRAISSDMLVVRGRADPGADPQRRRIADSVGPSPLTVASVLDGLAVEPLRARFLVGELLATGVLLPSVSASAETEVEVDFEPSDEIPTPYLDEDTQSADGPPRAFGPGRRDARSPGRDAPVARSRRSGPAGPSTAARERVVSSNLGGGGAATPVPARAAAREARKAVPPSLASVSGTSGSAGPSGSAGSPRTPPALTRSAQPVPARRLPVDGGFERYEDRETAGPGSTPQGVPARDAGGVPPRDAGGAPARGEGQPVPGGETATGRTARRLGGETTRAIAPGEGFASAPHDPPHPPPHPHPHPLGGTASGTTILPLGSDMTPSGIDDEPTPMPRFRRMVRADIDDEDVDDDRTEQIDPRVYARQSRASRGLADWLNRTEEESHDDDEVAIFSDHDHERGSDGTGQFGTDRHHLDRVEVGSMDVQDDDEVEAEVIEADEVPVTRYGAPVLGTADALAKIDVTNEVLTMVAAAFDDADGAGRGRAVLQLMVDGVPSQFAVVLHDLSVSDAGEIDSSQLLRNLDIRPATEHRQLLNNSLFDLIERALSAAADELPDDAIDDLLASVAGYRQRLGL
jgi:hypothetical protein